MIEVQRLDDAGRRAFLTRLAGRERGIPADVRETARAIVEDVRTRGDEAAFDYTERFDGVRLTAATLTVSEAEINAAVASVPAEVLRAMERAAENITAFHRRQVQQSWLDMTPGSLLGQKIMPLSRVAVYVPGGRAAYPSSVLMNVLPAKVAGVGEICVTTPTQRDGTVYANTLAAAKVAGVDRVYKLGGAQAIAAFAYGTALIPRVDKITGPGNIYVAAAKREVFGAVGIDSIAGPSEVLIVADSTANPRFVAADLLAQAEHDPMASATLVTDSAELAAAVARELEVQLATLSRREIAAASLRGYGALLVTDTLAEAMELANELAPEHMELMVCEPMEWLGQVRNAGAVFLGDSTPEPLGDYLAGPNHVLPTGGTARFFSPLSVDDFVKKTSVLYHSRAKLAEVWMDVEAFALSEGLTAHARSASIRFEED